MKYRTIVDLNAGYAPKRIKLARILRIRIQRGDFSDGQYLSRIKLAAEYDVSPNTAFYALSTLAANGYAKIENYDFPRHIGSRFRVAHPQQPRKENPHAEPRLESRESRGPR